MAIEDLTTKADLERFIDDRLLQQPISNIQGLSDRLARTDLELGAFDVNAFRLETDVVPGEGLPGCKFVAEGDMTGIAIGVMDSSIGGLVEEGGVGLHVVDCFVEGVGQGAEIIHSGAGRGTFAQVWPFALKKEGEIELVSSGEKGVIHADHTGLIIVRLT